MMAPHTCTPKLYAVALVSEPLPSSHMLVESASRFGYDLRVLVLDHSRSNFVFTRVSAMLSFLQAQCQQSVVMLLDAYDVFFYMPAEVVLQRFRAAKADVVWSVERSFSAQDPADQPFYEEQRRRNNSAGQPRGIPYGFINSGGFMGFAGSLASLVAEALTIRPGAAGWRNKTCGEPHGRLCADQWIFGHLIANTWNRFNISLDYERSIFYVASIHDWSYSTASMRIKETQPAVVHMPFIQAPRVNATLHALYAGHVIGRPPPEANRSVCTSRVERCQHMSYGALDMQRTLERIESQPRAPDELLAKFAEASRARGGGAAGRRLTKAHASATSSMVTVALGQSMSGGNGGSRAGAPKLTGRLAELQAAMRLQSVVHGPPPLPLASSSVATLVRDAACSGYGLDIPLAPRNPFVQTRCERVRDMLNLSVWSEVAAQLSPRHLHRTPAFFTVMDRAIWAPLPWCYRPPAGIRTTWISC